MSMATQPRELTAHEEFSNKAHLIRWFHERSYKELSALKRAFEASKKKAKRKGGDQ